MQPFKSLHWKEPKELWYLQYRLFQKHQPVTACAGYQSRICFQEVLRPQTIPKGNKGTVDAQALIALCTQQQREDAALAQV